MEANTEDSTVQSGGEGGSDSAENPPVIIHAQVHHVEVDHVGSDLGDPQDSPSSSHQDIPDEDPDAISPHEQLNDGFDNISSSGDSELEEVDGVENVDRDEPGEKEKNSDGSAGLGEDGVVGGESVSGVGGVQGTPGPPGCQDPPHSTPLAGQGRPPPVEISPPEVPQYLETDSG